MRVRATFVLGALVVMAGVNDPESLHAQRDSGAGMQTDITVGALRYGTGDDANCDPGVGLSGGVDVRSRGRWFWGGRADILSRRL